MTHCQAVTGCRTGKHVDNVGLAYRYAVVSGDTSAITKLIMKSTLITMYAVGCTATWLTAGIYNGRQ